MHDFLQSTLRLDRLSKAQSIRVDDPGRLGNGRRSIERHLRSVVADDELLVKEGIGDWLTHPELLEALWERGMYVHLVHFSRAS